MEGQEPVPEEPYELPDEYKPYFSDEPLPPRVIAAQTVGELVQELGSEQAAMTHIVAYNIKLRMAVDDALVVLEGYSGRVVDTAKAILREALNDLSR